MFQNYFSRFSSRRQKSENFVFYLHYRWTVLLLVALSFIVTFKLFLGYSFSCKVREPLDNIRCYSHTHSMPGLNTDAAAINYNSIKPETYRRYQSYYQWVNLLLLVHAFNFYLPHLLWKSFKSEYISRLADGIKTGGDEDTKELRYLANYISVTQGNHKWYTTTYILCELLNFVVALSHTLWLVYFFDVTGVPDDASYKIETWEDFKGFYFPSSARCTFKTIGASGDTQLQSIYCLLPLNHLYMLVFLFLRAWYVFLVILSGVVLIYRAAALFPYLRFNLAKFSYPQLQRTTLKSVCYKMSYSNWFFLSRFQKIMNDLEFAEMIGYISNGKTRETKEDHSMTICNEINKDLNNFTDTSPL